MFKTIASILLAAALTFGASVDSHASYAPSGVLHSVTHPVPPTHSHLPVWKAKAASRIVKLAARLDKLFPTRHARDGDRRPTDTFAIVSLCCAIGGTVIPLLGSIAAIIFGVLALKRIRESGDAGKGMAIAGIIIGGLGVLFYLAYFAIILAFLL